MLVFVLRTAVVRFYPVFFFFFFSPRFHIFCDHVPFVTWCKKTTVASRSRSRLEFCVCACGAKAAIFGKDSHLLLVCFCLFYPLNDVKFA